MTKPTDRDLIHVIAQLGDVTGPDAERAANLAAAVREDVLRQFDALLSLWERDRAGTSVCAEMRELIARLREEP